MQQFAERRGGEIPGDVLPEPFAHMQALLSQPWMLGLYLVGLLLSVFHLAYGLASMAIVWGLTTSVRAQALFGWVCVLIGLLLAVMGVHGLMGFLS